MRHPSYQRSQVLWLLWVLLPAGTVAVAASVLSGAVHAPLAVVATVATLQLGVLLAFGRFTIEVDAEAIEWRFGLLGVPRWRLLLAEVSAVEVASSGWAEGWGIRRTSQGMLYNASGFGAVRLRCRDGRTLRLGSDEPERLAGFIARRLPRR